VIHTGDLPPVLGRLREVVPAGAPGGAPAAADPPGPPAATSLSRPRS
jgi:hypothetical protein